MDFFNRVRPRSFARKKRTSATTPATPTAAASSQPAPPPQPNDIEHHSYSSSPGPAYSEAIALERNLAAHRPHLSTESAASSTQPASCSPARTSSMQSATSDGSNQHLAAGPAVASATHNFSQSLSYSPVPASGPGTAAERLEKANRKTRYIFDEQQKASVRFTYLCAFLETADRSEKTWFFRIHADTIFAVVLATVVDQLDRLRRRSELPDSPTAKEIVAFLKPYAVLRKLIYYLPEKVEQGWHAREVAWMLSALLDPLNHPQVVREGFLLLLEWINMQGHYDSLTAHLYRDTLIQRVFLSEFNTHSAQSANLPTADARLRARTSLPPPGHGLGSLTPGRRPVADSPPLQSVPRAPVHQPARSDTLPHERRSNSSNEDPHDAYTNPAGPITRQTRPLTAADTLELVQLVLSNLKLLTNASALSSAPEIPSSSPSMRRRSRVMEQIYPWRLVGSEALTTARFMFTMFKDACLLKLFPTWAHRHENVASSTWATKDYGSCHPILLRPLIQFLVDSSVARSAEAYGIHQPPLSSRLCQILPEADGSPTLLSSPSQSIPPPPPPPASAAPHRYPLVNRAILSRVEDLDLLCEILRQVLRLPAGRAEYADLHTGAIGVLRNWLFSRVDGIPLFLAFFNPSDFTPAPVASSQTQGRRHSAAVPTSQPPATSPYGPALGTAAALSQPTLPPLGTTHEVPNSTTPAGDWWHGPCDRYVSAFLQMLAEPLRDLFSGGDFIPPTTVTTCCKVFDFLRALAAEQPVPLSPDNWELLVATLVGIYESLPMNHVYRSAREFGLAAPEPDPAAKSHRHRQSNGSSRSHDTVGSHSSGTPAAPVKTANPEPSLVIEDMVGQLVETIFICAIASRSQNAALWRRLTTSFSCNPNWRSLVGFWGFTVSRIAVVCSQQFFTHFPLPPALAEPPTSVASDSEGTASADTIESLASVVSEGPDPPPSPHRSVTTLTGQGSVALPDRLRASHNNRKLRYMTLGFGSSRQRRHSRALSLGTGEAVIHANAAAGSTAALLDHSRGRSLDQRPRSQSPGFPSSPQPPPRQPSPVTRGGSAPVSPVHSESSTPTSPHSPLGFTTQAPRPGRRVREFISNQATASFPQSHGLTIESAERDYSQLRPRHSATRNGIQPAPAGTTKPEARGRSRGASFKAAISRDRRRLVPKYFRRQLQRSSALVNEVDGSDANSHTNTPPLSTRGLGPGEAPGDMADSQYSLGLHSTVSSMRGAISREPSHQPTQSALVLRSLDTLPTTALIAEGALKDRLGPHTDWDETSYAQQLLLDAQLYAHPTQTNRAAHGRFVLGTLDQPCVGLTTGVSALVYLERLVDSVNWYERESVYIWSQLLSVIGHPNQILYVPLLLSMVRGIIRVCDTFNSVNGLLHSRSAAFRRLPYEVVVNHPKIRYLLTPQPVSASRTAPPLAADAFPARDDVCPLDAILLHYSPWALAPFLFEVCFHPDVRSRYQRARLMDPGPHLDPASQPGSDPFTLAGIHGLIGAMPAPIDLAPGTKSDLDSDSPTCRAYPLALAALCRLMCRVQPANVPFTFLAHFYHLIITSLATRKPVVLNIIYNHCYPLFSVALPHVEILAIPVAYSVRRLLVYSEGLEPSARANALRLLLAIQLYLQARPDRPCQVLRTNETYALTFTAGVTVTAGQLNNELIRTVFEPILFAKENWDTTEPGVFLIVRELVHGITLFTVTNLLAVRPAFTPELIRATVLRLARLLADDRLEVIDLAVQALLGIINVPNAAQRLPAPLHLDYLHMVLWTIHIQLDRFACQPTRPRANIVMDAIRCLLEWLMRLPITFMHNHHLSSLVWPTLERVFSVDAEVVGLTDSPGRPSSLGLAPHLARVYRELEQLVDQISPGEPGSTNREDLQTGIRVTPSKLLGYFPQQPPPSPPAPLAAENPEQAKELCRLLRDTAAVAIDHLLVHYDNFPPRRGVEYARSSITEPYLDSDDPDDTDNMFLALNARSLVTFLRPQSTGSNPIIMIRNAVGKFQFVEHTYRVVQALEEQSTRSRATSVDETSLAYGCDVRCCVSQGSGPGEDGVGVLRAPAGSTIPTPFTWPKLRDDLPEAAAEPHYDKMARDVQEFAELEDQALEDESRQAAVQPSPYLPMEHRYATIAYRDSRSHDGRATDHLIYPSSLLPSGPGMDGASGKPGTIVPDHGWCVLSRSKNLYRDIRHLDTLNPLECIKVAVLYVGNQQIDETSILANTAGSPAYETFVKTLGWEVDLRTHTGYTGRLLRNGSDGETAIYYCTSFLEIMFHDATRIPTDPRDRQCIRKKRHVGNDHVHIVWNENNMDFIPGTISGDFGNVQIIINPLSEELCGIRTFHDRKVSTYGPLMDGTVVKYESLGPLVRATAIHAQREIFRNRMPHALPPYVVRHREIAKLTEKHGLANLSAPTLGAGLASEPPEYTNEQSASQSTASFSFFR
ncbi:hypothetical protein IWQ60_000099 [Tieghemiomyces parasiticus]|uniref:Rap-GAP domain-containing protein n=1 Tax=Tieghemiomyces parasiticus TaxID=78921 RepID=A0A9W8E3T2_9FUNG|nr:hypothetical protein IWQ60_000099 [Tieghemiomyces parasiticus]